MCDVEQGQGGIVMKKRGGGLNKAYVVVGGLYEQALYIEGMNKVIIKSYESII